jgi:hypothetical protein
MSFFIRTIRVRVVGWGMPLVSLYGRLRQQVIRLQPGRTLALVEPLVNAAGIAIALVWFVALLLPYMKMVTQPGPQEYNEPAIWHVTWLLDHGRNPYTAPELPGAVYCFSPLYNFVVLALKPLLGIDYAAHRMVSLSFLLASLGLLVRLMRKAGAGLGIALLSAVFYLWMCLGNIMITARPDTMGLFFFLLGLFVPWEKNYSRWSVVFGLGCAVVAFQCKFYFALAGCGTLLGVWMVRSFREGWWLGLGYLAVLVLSFAGFSVAFPYYYIETVVIQQGGALLNSNDGASAWHTVMLFDRGWPFLLLIVAGLGLWFSDRAGPGPVSLPRASHPLEMRLGVLGAILAIFLVLVYFYMGRNSGAYFTYHLHLLFPLMMVLAAYAASRPWRKIGAGLLLAVFVTVRLTIPPVPASAVPYHRLEELASTTRGEILGIAAMTDIFERTHRRVLHNGNTMFTGFAFANDGIERDPMIATLAQNYNATIAEVRGKVAAREYALVFTEFDQPYFCTTELLQANYDRVEQIDYYTYFGNSPVRVWRPKPR